MTRQLLILSLTALTFQAIGQTNYKFEYKLDTTSGSCFFSMTRYQCKFDYPKAALEKNIQGTVLMSFELNDKCEMTNIKIIKGLGYGLNEIATNIITALGKDMKKNHRQCCSPGQPLAIPVRFTIKE